MNNDNNKKDIVLIGKFVFGAIVLGLILVSFHQLFNKSGFLLPVIWALGFLIIGGLLGFLYGMPRILFADETPNSSQPVNPSSNQTAQRRNTYQVSSHLDRISEWLTTLIVGLTLVQWDRAVSNFNSISGFIANGIDPGNIAANQPFAASIMAYFSVLGFIGAYLMTRVYLSGVFERTDVGNGLGLEEGIRYRLNQSDQTNLRDVSLRPDLQNVAQRILKFRLEELISLEDIIAWSKAQLSAHNYENAVSGYKKATTTAPTDIRLRLEYVNALYHAGTTVTDAAIKKQYRAESEAQLLTAYGLLSPSTEPETKMKVYRAISFFYLYSDPPKGFENTIKYGEEFVNDGDARKIHSVGVIVNLAAAYGQQYRWLKENNGAPEQLEAARQNSLKYSAMAIGKDRNGIWLRRLQTLFQRGVEKDPSDDDLEIFENDQEFRVLFGFAARITLPDIATDAGLIARLLLAECRGPGFADYDESAAKSAMKAMRAVVENRKQRPSLFLATGNSTLQIVTAPPGAADHPQRQFAGFFLGADGRLAISPAVQARIDDILARANSGVPGRFAAFVNNAIAIAQGAVEDPFSGLTSINGTAVKAGAFGWRPEGNPISGPLFVQIPASMSGVILRTQFYALKGDAF